MDLVCRWEEKRDFNFELEHFESTDSDLSAGIELALAGHIPPDLTVFSPSYGKKARMHN